MLVCSTLIENPTTLEPKKPLKGSCWFRVWYAVFALTPIIFAACETDGHFTLFNYTTRPVYDETIQTVRIPIFGNETTRQGLEFDLHKALVREIESKTPFRVVPAHAAADTELIGKIISVNKAVTNVNQLGETREAQLTLGVQVEWRDLRPKALGEVVRDPLGNPTDQLPPGGPGTEKKPPSVLVQSLSTFVPELGQSFTSSQTELARKMAVQIRSMMEKTW
ncbi:MAG: LptE family protein [Gemmataceae bacterium]